MGKKHFLGIMISLLILIFACAQQQPTEQRVPDKKVEARPAYKSLSKEEQILLSKDTWSIQHLSQMRLALLFYYKDHKDYPQNISALIPKYLPLTAERRGAYNSDQFHYFRCSSEDFHIGVSLYFNHDPIDLGSDNKAMWLASDLDKKVCTNDPIQFEDNSKCFSSDIGNHCLDLGKEEIAEKVVVGQPKENPVIGIVSPKENDLVKNSKVTVQVDAENFNIVPVGSPVKGNEGHFHVWLDSERKVTTDKTITFENVVSGKHTIVAELFKSDHSPLSPRVAKTITINVESDYVPKPVEQQQGIAEFTVEADDYGFYPGAIKAKIGDKVKINFKFRDGTIYYAGLDIKGPFEDVKYKLKDNQPITREFIMKDETKITSYWPASGVKKATLTVEVEK